MASEAKELHDFREQVNVAIDRYVAELIARAETAERRVTEAEQQLASEREKQANAMRQLELIARGEHPMYWTLEPGDVLYRAIETREPRKGEWFKWLDAAGFGIATADFHRGNVRTIYRRIEAPSEAKAIPLPTLDTDGQCAVMQPLKFDGEKLVPGDTIVEIDGKRYRREAVARLPKNGEKFYIELEGVVTVERDFDHSKFHILHEITEAEPAAEADSRPELAPSPETGEQRERHYVVAGDSVWYVWEYRGPLGKFLVASGETPEIAKSIAAYLNGNAPEHATIREQAAEIERIETAVAELISFGNGTSGTLKGDLHILASFIAEAREWAAENTSLRAQLQQAKECQRCEARYTRMLMLMADCGISLEPMAGVGAAKCWRASMQGETWSYFHSAIDAVEAAASNYDARKAAPSQPAKPETADNGAPARAAIKAGEIVVTAPAAASEGSKFHEGEKCGGCSGPLEVTRHAICETCAPDPEFAPSPAPAAESGKVDERRVYGGWLTESEYQWLNRRAEIESQLAQLAAYKRGHEAWEAVKKWKIGIDLSHDGKDWVARGWRRDELLTPHASDPVDAVLALAAKCDAQS